MKKLNVSHKFVMYLFCIIIQNHLFSQDKVDVNHYLPCYFSDEYTIDKKIKIDYLMSTGSFKRVKEKKGSYKISDFKIFHNQNNNQIYFKVKFGKKHNRLIVKSNNSIKKIKMLGVSEKGKKIYVYFKLISERCVILISIGYDTIYNKLNITQYDNM
jgi:hypothetical protein